MKTLVYSIHGFDKPFIQKAANGKHDLDYTEHQLNENTTHHAKGFDAVVLFTSDNASAKVIEQLHALGIRYIALRSAGYDHVNIAKAKELGIKLANVPAYSPHSIAEHAVALLLALNRKLILGQQLIKQNDFRLDKLVGFNLHNKTIGIIGTGKIGAAFARIMNGFGCKLLAYDIEENKKLIDDVNIKYTSLEEVCKNSDVISVCCPMNEATKHMFNKTTFSLMKKGVVFINTSRGGVVNTIDLINAIDTGILSAAGLDVYEHEKPIFFHDHTSTIMQDKVFEKLREYENVLITGHQAFLTHEALSGIASITIDNLDQWSLNGFSENDII
jgi:D-lactate dehydrogenase